MGMVASSWRSGYAPVVLCYFSYLIICHICQSYCKDENCKLSMWITV